jgi:hypothetical protein
MTALLGRLVLSETARERGAAPRSGDVRHRVLDQHSPSQRYINNVADENNVAHE